MAHYACDCWDAEIRTSAGWIECVGAADRSAYDLTVHGNFTGKPLVVRQTLEKPLTIQEWQVEIDKKKFGPIFKKDAKAVETALLAIPQDKREALAKELEVGKTTFEVPEIGKVDLDSNWLTVAFRSRTENVREFVPNVIEPSFGIGRILTALCEHNFWTRASEGGGDESRGVLSFPPLVAPTKVLLVPLSSNPAFKPYIKKIQHRLRAAQISARVDDSSASIGKRYSRNDELGTPLGITVDFQTIKDGTITLRDRDSTRQVRGEEEEVVKAIIGVVNGELTWADVEKQLPVFETQEAEIPVR